MNDFRELIQKIHDSPPQGVLAVSGAGTQAIAWLMGVAGASRTVLEVVVPYASQSMIDFVGNTPNQYVSMETARDMARAAYRRALHLREGEPPVLGLACTATIATDRPKRGEHRCYIVTWDEAGTAAYSLRLAKGHRDRAGEEALVSLLVLQALAAACAVETELDLGLMAQDDLNIHQDEHQDPISRLLAGEASSVTVHSDGRMEVDSPVCGALLPGSFSPLHTGHAELARTAEETLGTGVCFELSVVNVDKPPLTKDEVERRLAQFVGKETVVLTRAETFHKKSGLFPGSTFVIGWDTAIRLVAPRYYGGEETAMLAALAGMWSAGCRFLVAGREEGGAFHTLDDVAIPEGFGPMFQSIPESRFRKDISSTALRRESEEARSKSSAS